MISLDKNALICDFAEYYNILDIDRLDIFKLAILAVGLPSKSRIYKKMSGQRLDLDNIILAGVFDRLNLILYSFAGKKGSKAPVSLVDSLIGDVKPKKDLKRAYISGKEFEERKQEILRKIGGSDE